MSGCSVIRFVRSWEPDRGVNDGPGPPSLSHEGMLSEGARLVRVGVGRGHFGLFLKSVMFSYKFIVLRSKSNATCTCLPLPSFCRSRFGGPFAHSRW